MSEPPDLLQQFTVVPLQHKVSHLLTDLFRYKHYNRKGSKIHQGQTTSACPRWVSGAHLRPLANANIRCLLIKSSVWVALPSTYFHTVLICNCLSPDTGSRQCCTSTDPMSLLSLFYANRRLLTIRVTVPKKRLSNERVWDPSGCKTHSMCKFWDTLTRL